MMVRSQRGGPGLGSGLKTAQVLEGPAGCEEEEKEEQEEEERVDLLGPPAALEPAGCSDFLLGKKRKISASFLTPS